MGRKIVSFDWAIKYILRNKANYVVLEGFLLALLGEEIKIVELLESESNQDNRSLKYNRVDLIAKNVVGEHIIVEVQYSPEKDYFKRLLYGTSKDITDNIKAGDDYSNIKKVYSISLIYFDVEAVSDGLNHKDYVYHGKLNFTGLHNQKQIHIDNSFLLGYDYNRKEEINIFPEYFILSMSIFDNQIRDSLDEWIYSFKNHEVQDEFKSPGIKEMSEKLSYVSMSPEDQKKYNKYLEDLASDRGALKYAEEKGFEKGIEEGREEGIDAVARELLKEGSKPAFVSKVTGLSLKYIDKIIAATEDKI